MKNLVKFTREILQEVEQEQKEEKPFVPTDEVPSEGNGFSSSASLKQIFQDNLRNMTPESRHISLVKEERNQPEESFLRSQAGRAAGSSKPFANAPATSTAQVQRKEGHTMPVSGFSDSDLLRKAIRDNIDGIEEAEEENRRKIQPASKPERSESGPPPEPARVHASEEEEITQSRPPKEDIGLSDSQSLKSALFDSLKSPSSDEDKQEIPAPRKPKRILTRESQKTSASPEEAAPPQAPDDEATRIQNLKNTLKQTLESTPGEAPGSPPVHQTRTAPQPQSPPSAPPEAAAPPPSAPADEPSAQAQQPSGHTLSNAEVRELEMLRNQLRQKYSSGETQSAPAINAKPAAKPKVPPLETTDQEKFANQLYMELHQLWGKILNDIKDKKPIDPKQLEKLVPSICESVKKNEFLFMKAIQRKRFATWLVSHSVNVGIFAAKIAKGLKYDEKKQEEVTLAALLHDVGMSKVPNRILFKHGKLTPSEFDHIKKHPNDGYKLVEHLKEEYPYVLDTVYQEQEREDGSGYPKGIKGDKIHEYAKIVGIADIFEALVHGRAYRPGFITYTAIQKIMERNAKQYNPKILRALISVVSMFPVGSLVQLSTGEIARVVAINQSRSVRPVVDVVQDADGTNLEPPRRMNLEQEPLIYITKPITEA